MPVFTRKIDDLNRVVLSREICSELGWTGGMKLDILFDRDDRSVVLREHSPRCALCGSMEQKKLIETPHGHICGDCARGALEKSGDS